MKLLDALPYLSFRRLQKEYGTKVAVKTDDPLQDAKAAPGRARYWAEIFRTVRPIGRF